MAAEKQRRVIASEINLIFQGLDFPPRVKTCLTGASKCGYQLELVSPIFALFTYSFYFQEEKACTANPLSNCNV